MNLENQKKTFANIIPLKKLGQHFLVNRSVIRTIVETAGNLENINVIEIGPGLGNMTTEIISKNPKTLTLIEFDTRFADILKSFNNCNLIFDDALKIDFTKIISPPSVIISNLPYNISVEILYKLMPNFSLFQFFIFMFQKEVADRIIAPKNCKDYGKLSVIMQAFCDIERVTNVSPGSFSPAPKVSSTVLKIIPKKIDNNFNKELFNSFLTKLFASRRKKLKNKLTQIINKHDNFIISKYDLRAEDLSVEECLELFAHVE